jgi:membrane protease YdiL (CAAX protease family)
VTSSARKWTSLPADRTRWWCVVLSPIAVIAVCAGVQHAAGPWLGVWSWVPTMLVFWASIAGVIAWGRGDAARKTWFGRPRGGVAWSVLAVVVSLGAVREFLSGWHSLESPGVLALWLVFGLVNPWFEEAYWRGLLIDAAGRWKAAGVVYSTTFFAISHPLIWGVHSVALRSPAALMGLGVVGAVWGIVYARTGSLRWTIVGHCCANLLGLSVPILLNLHVPAGLK